MGVGRGGRGGRKGDGRAEPVLLWSGGKEGVTYMRRGLRFVLPGTLRASLSGTFPPKDVVNQCLEFASRAVLPPALRIQKHWHVGGGSSLAHLSFSESAKRLVLSRLHVLFLVLNSVFFVLTTVSPADLRLRRCFHGKRKSVGQRFYHLI